MGLSMYDDDSVELEVPSETSSSSSDFDYKTQQTPMSTPSPTSRLVSTTAAESLPVAASASPTTTTAHTTAEGADWTRASPQLASLPDSVATANVSSPPAGEEEALRATQPPPPPPQHQRAETAKIDREGGGGAAAAAAEKRLSNVTAEAPSKNAVGVDRSSPSLRTLPVSWPASEEDSCNNDRATTVTASLHSSSPSPASPAPPPPPSSVHDDAVAAPTNLTKAVPLKSPASPDDPRKVAKKRAATREKASTAPSPPSPSPSPLSPLPSAVPPPASVENATEAAQQQNERQRAAKAKRANMSCNAAVAGGAKHTEEVRPTEKKTLVETPPATACSKRPPHYMTGTSVRPVAGASPAVTAAAAAPSSSTASPSLHSMPLVRTRVASSPSLQPAPDSPRLQQQSRQQQELSTAAPPSTPSPTTTQTTTTTTAIAKLNSVGKADSTGATTRGSPPLTPPAQPAIAPARCASRASTSFAEPSLSPSEDSVSRRRARRAAVTAAAIGNVNNNGGDGAAAAPCVGTSTPKVPALRRANTEPVNVRSRDEGERHKSHSRPKTDASSVAAARQSSRADVASPSPSTPPPQEPQPATLSFELMDRYIYQNVMVYPPAVNERIEMPPVMERPLSYYELGMCSRHAAHVPAHYKRALLHEQRALLRNAAWLPMTTVLDQRSGGVGAMMMADFRHMARVIRYAQERENWKAALTQRAAYDAQCAEMIHAAAMSSSTMMNNSTKSASGGWLKAASPSAHRDFSATEVDDDSKSASKRAGSASSAAPREYSALSASASRATATAVIADAKATTTTAATAAGAPKKEAEDMAKDKKKKQKDKTEMPAFLSWLVDAFSVERKRDKKSSKKAAASRPAPVARPTAVSAPATSTTTTPTTSAAALKAASELSVAPTRPAASVVSPNPPPPLQWENSITVSLSSTLLIHDGSAAAAAPAHGNISGSNAGNNSDDARCRPYAEDSSSTRPVAVTVETSPAACPADASSPFAEDLHVSRFPGRSVSGAGSIELPPPPIPVFRLYHFHPLEVVQELKRMVWWAAVHKFVVLRVLTGTIATARAAAAAVVAKDGDDDVCSCNVSPRRKRHVAAAVAAAARGEERGAATSLSGSRPHHNSFASLSSLDSRSPSTECVNDAPYEAAYFNTVLLTLRIDRWLVRHAVLTRRDAARGLVELEVTELAEAEAADAAQREEKTLESQLAHPLTNNDSTSTVDRQAASALAYFFNAETHTPR
ncbi:hypothetical protein ABB37_07175 [Leptomonas pyrrhocoris]|uniref:Uncharacterized protein n=1 Tax=Leptomonas pyrrhocoris TaxID=157538 RepID=A0A0N0VEA0_LEPPY|nr:hypothetical protein ABB37_07175 [Leptomonas pyrrhocoris]XP_015655722.1 hypothetical protein ABB37_07175 [Leptomonas pyrrhocoris]KPA77282.1 hypothetical protein ABB37_07175 [Leptomonas pyrrhocoris]KPA77283.1 hypothetical protein ABB37_07175 [Leptomonas pyrrhocoris]|eukprot:XP_015655721.1 hypothetical protein ABB37_07175 [Leptomonas pyrrhocoris]